MANFNKRFFGMVVLSLILFFGIFLIQKETKASGYFNNFDSYASSTDISTVDTQFLTTAKGIVSNIYSTSTPNSLRLTNDMSFNLATTSPFVIITFSFMVREDYFFIGAYNRVIMAYAWDLSENNANHTLKLRIDGDNNKIITLSSGIVSHQWDKIDIKFNYLTGIVNARLNNNSWTSDATTSQIYVNSLIFSGMGSAENSKTYFDDFNINDGIDTSKNGIFLTNPGDTSIQNKNIFYWAYNFTISSSSYAAYDSFDTQIEYIPPIAGATSTFIESNWYKPAVQPETIYIVIDNQIYNIPLYLGDYTAGAYLIGLKNDTFDILASDFVNFTMSEGTTTAPTAWCSGLCRDLATTTSAWWPPLVCAGRYTICYAMYPHDLTKQMFWQAYSDFKLVFPFNIFFEITSTIDNVFASTTMASTTGSFGLPMIKKVGTTSQYYILPLLTSTTTANFLGNANANLLRFSLSSIIYAFYTVGIILILW